MKRDRSRKLFERAQNAIPGGVNSPVRAFRGVGGDPIFVTRAEGSYIYDADGNRYIDYVGSWGPLILGHAAPEVVEAVQDALHQGTSFGWATEREVELAERVCAAVDSVERVRFVNSGTEATMSAVRLARGFTKRDLIVKFAGCYHGHADAFLSESSGSGVATLGIPGSSGVPEGAAKDTLTVDYNDVDAFVQLMAAQGQKIAAVIVEPVACNMGLVQPDDGFLAELRSQCDKHGALLIFDEVITGFRLGLGGAQQHFDMRADLTTFGKVVGGGLPVGAYGGRKDVMDAIAPLGPVYQAGTLSGNPLAMAAGCATLDVLARRGFHDELLAKTERFVIELKARIKKEGVAVGVDSIASIFYLFMNPSAAPPRNYSDIKKGDTELFGRYFHQLLEQGVAIAPSAFEVGFVSRAHTEQQLGATATAMGKALRVASESA